MVGEETSLGGSDCKALAINGARCTLCDAIATTGFMPRCWVLSAVILSWKWILAANDGFEGGCGVGHVSKTATEVSSLYRISNFDLCDRVKIVIPRRFNGYGK